MTTSTDSAPIDSAGLEAEASGDASVAALKKFFQRYMANPDTQFSDVVNGVHEEMTKHFGVDAAAVPTSSVKYKSHLVVCYQRAIDEFLARPGVEQRATGVRCPSVRDWDMGDMALARMMCPPSFAFVPPVFCAPDYVMLPCGVDKKQPCLRQGLIMFRDEDGPGAFWIRTGGFGEVTLEVAAPTLERVELLLAKMRKDMARLAPFRGEVVKIEYTPAGLVFTFLGRPRDTDRHDVILPPGLLDQIERHSIGALNAHEALLETGRHLKRGLLLHGPPGTGKTHTIKYLTSQMPHATVVIMSAGRMYSLEVIREVVDLIVPAVIVLDDVDLIAEDRELAGSRQQLFELLDLLDGIREDSDLLFVMTTNRPNEIEPAIAARPGRIDQAIEVPLPDADCRRRLFDLYCEDLGVEMTDAERDEFFDRTDGVTAAFIREALRRATVAALRDGGDDAPVAGHYILRALDDLLSPDNPLTPLLLGAAPRHAVPTISLAAPSGAPAQ